MAAAAVAGMQARLPSVGVLLLVTLLAAAVACCAAVQPLEANDPAVDQIAAQCPLAVRYEVSLGQGLSGSGGSGNGTAGSPTVPIFVAVMTVQNNANVSGGAGAGGRAAPTQALGGRWVHRLAGSRLRVQPSARLCMHAVCR